MTSSHREQALVDALRKAAGRLAFMARTSGGTAGRDEKLCIACDAVENILAAYSSPDQAPLITSIEKMAARMGAEFIPDAEKMHAFAKPAPPPGDVGEMVNKLGGPHEWGYRDVTDGKFIADYTPFDAAAVITTLSRELAACEGALKNSGHVVDLLNQDAREAERNSPVDMTVDEQLDAMVLRFGVEAFMAYARDGRSIERMKDKWKREALHTFAGLAHPYLDRANTAEREHEKMRRALEPSQKALQPFFDRVFDDNGDLTVDMSGFSYEQIVAGYFAYKRARAALGEGEGGTDGTI